MTEIKSAALSETQLRYLPLSQVGDVSRLPTTVKILLEGVLRAAARGDAAERDAVALAKYPASPPADASVPFRPSRILLQDYTGVPAAVDLAAMRAAMKRAGKDPAKIEPQIPVDLIIDHSVQADFFGAKDVYERNLEREYERNRERYALLRWAGQAFKTFRVVPPGAGICHQVNLERLAEVVVVRDGVAMPDTLFGADSHTTMINGLGVLGWGVGGIEAEAAMLGQPTYLPWPVVVGVKLVGQLPIGTTATDLVLTLTELFRRKGVVNKFIEFAGEGLSSLAVAERATVANMCPEYGATSALFPVDRQTLRYLEQTGRPRELIALVERYTKAQGMFRSDGGPTPAFDELIEVDLGSVKPSVAGPKRPQDRVDLPMIWDSFTGPKPTTGVTLVGNSEGPKPINDAAQTMVATATPETAAVAHRPRTLQVSDGSVVIAAITSCTNTSNPSVMIAAGLLAKKAIERGLAVKPHVKTTFAPGSRVVTRYLEAAGLTPYFEQLGFYLVGFGCTVCIGNTGPLATPEIEQEVKDHDLNVVSVLSGNRNFEGRIHPLVKSSYLASPPLVVAFALAGTVHIDLQDQPIGNDKQGKPVFLKDIWPTPDEVNAVVGKAITQEMYATEYGKIFEGDRFWKTMPSPTGLSYQWDPNSTYVQEPPFFQNFSATPPARIPDIVGARVLVSVGDSVTTDHISPAGAIPAASPAGQYLVSKGVKAVDFNQYGTRRGNHEVLIRGTFANIRLRNKLADKEGWWTRHIPSGDAMTIYDAAVRYQKDGVPLLVFAGKEYGSGSSRDWAAKGPNLMGVRAAIAESFERIHRSNLVMMGVLPLEFTPGETLASLGLTGAETFTIRGLDRLAPRAKLTVEAASADGKKTSFQVLARVDDPTDVEYVRQGGILQQVLRERIAAN
ncbi:MAG: aconitate hydratase AcnA [Chloroflexi bacterium]|nr:MAG: aconitate hydratase AcnA [Chloroflexota bacterium]TMF57976.1 MAG: aconitate hydratase AcnA [Chloroflexota bacterium]